MFKITAKQKVLIDAALQKIAEGASFAKILYRRIRNILMDERIKSVIGGNLALAVLAGSAFGDVTGFANSQPEITTLVVSQTPLTTRTTVRFPLEKIKYNQGFRLFHPGVDLDGEIGDAIYPIMDGRVKYVEKSRFLYGNSVVIEHKNGYESLYAHLSKIEVSEGDEVDQKTQIGKVGSTGRSTGSHLHLEVRDQGRPINPRLILPDKI